VPTELCAGGGEEERTWAVGKGWKPTWGLAKEREGEGKSSFRDKITRKVEQCKTEKKKTNTKTSEWRLVASAGEEGQVGGEGLANEKNGKYDPLTAAQSKGRQRGKKKVRPKKRGNNEKELRRESLLGNSPCTAK